MAPTATRRRANLATANRKLYEAAKAIRRVNCLLVQLDIDRTGVATVGTCWWSDSQNKLLAVLPDTACWVCKLREAVDRVEELRA